MKGWLDKIKIGKNSIEGYRNDSPDRFNDINIINSPNISMQNVDHPITAYPSSGKPTVMYPGAEYYFPGAEYVTEVPHKQLGGDIEQKWLTTRQNGGTIQKFQIGGTSKDNQDSKVAQRVKMDDWLTKYPSDQVVRPTHQGMSPELANVHMDKYAQQQGFQTYGDMQNAQAMRDNPNWEKAGEFANKVADIYGAVEGAGYLGRGALRKLAEKHWGEPAGAAERYTVAPRDADSYITWGKKNPNVSVQNIDGPESSKISDMSLVEGPNPRDMTKEQKILKSFGLDPYQKGTAVEANRANIIKGNNPNNLPDILSSTIEPHKFGGKVKNNWLQKYK